MDLLSIDLFLPLNSPLCNVCNAKPAVTREQLPLLLLNGILHLCASLYGVYNHFASVFL